MPVRLYVNLNVFLTVNINVSINNFSFKYICVVCYLKLRFPCLILKTSSRRLEDQPVFAGKRLLKMKSLYFE